MELIKSSKNLKGIPKDRLSDLPDVLLHQILSYTDLNTKQIVQLSLVLSKRWKNFWISIPYLDLDACHWDFTRNRDKKFLEFVNRVMLQLDASNRHKFRFAYQGFSYESQFKLWISQAALLCVDELHLERLSLPIAFFRHVKVLKLTYVSFSGFGLLSPHLVLDLPEVVYFSIKHCIHGLKSFCISASQLKHLILDNTMYIPECGIEIRSPNLASITLLGYLYDSFSVEVFSSLLTAEVSIKHLSYKPITEKQQGCLLEVLNAIKAVESLTLSAHNFNKTFPELLYELKVASTPFHNVEYISLDEWSKDNCVNIMENLVRRFPNVETMVLTKSFCNNPNGQEHVWRGDWRQDQRQVQQTSPECIFFHLKCIELQNFEWYDNVFELLKYLVRKSLTLENITIKTTRRILKDGENALVDIVRRISSLPKASSNVKIVTMVERGSEFDILFEGLPKVSPTKHQIPIARYR